MKTTKIVRASMLAALCCVATMIIKIPSPMKGYLNLGDCIVLLSGWLLSPGYAFGAAGIGSALADVFSGYAMYAPATFIIKGVMALIAYFCHEILHNQFGNTPSRIVGSAFAEITMVIGYFVFEAFIYDFAPAALNIPANLVQGVFGAVIGIFLIKVFERTKLF